MHQSSAGELFTTSRALADRTHGIWQAPFISHAVESMGSPSSLSKVQNEALTGCYDVIHNVLHECSQRVALVATKDDLLGLFTSVVVLFREYGP